MPSRTVVTARLNQDGKRRAFCRQFEKQKASFVCNIVCFTLIRA
jgi:hypothetical protein